MEIGRLTNINNNDDLIIFYDPFGNLKSTRLHKIRTAVKYYYTMSLNYNDTSLKYFIARRDTPYAK